MAHMKPRAGRTLTEWSRAWTSAVMLSPWCPLSISVWPQAPEVSKIATVRELYRVLIECPKQEGWAAKPGHFTKRFSEAFLELCCSFWNVFKQGVELQCGHRLSRMTQQLHLFCGRSCEKLALPFAQLPANFHQMLVCRCIVESC